MYYLHFEHIYNQQKANKLIPNFTILQKMQAFYLGKWKTSNTIKITGRYEVKLLLLEFAVLSIQSFHACILQSYAMLWHATLYVNSPNKIKCNGGFNNICNTQIFPGLHY